MSASVVCPRCRGTKVLQITPGYYECQGEIAVGGIPKYATGLPHDIPDLRPCGVRFHTGTPSHSSPCALCGRDSIGTCEGGCSRRLCGLHGTDDSPFLCEKCLGGLIADREKERNQSRRQANAEAERGRAELRSTLYRSSDPAAIARALIDQETMVDAGELTKMWPELLERFAIEHSHELLEVEGQSLHPFDHRGRWKESSHERKELWLASQVQLDHPRIRVDLLLGRDGAQWRSSGAGSTLWSDPGQGRRRQILAVPRGRLFEMVRQRGHFEVVDSIGLEQNLPPQKRDSANPSGSSRFVRAAASILDATPA